jgi:hypothetical protein
MGIIIGFLVVVYAAATLFAVLSTFMKNIDNHTHKSTNILVLR